MAALDGLPPLRAVIATHGLQARKQLGQNFLLDLNLTAKIARMAGDLAGCDVLEVGPGPGGLTRGLLAEGARRVLAIEKDARCLPALAEIAAAYPGRLEVIGDDAMTVDVSTRLTPPVRIVSNLPYNVGTELLVRWLSPPDWPPFWESLTLMFQREVAERIVARPGSKAYGRLALLSQWRTDPRIVLSLPPEAFTPAPKVHSAVVHFTRLEAPRYPANARTLTRIRHWPSGNVARCCAPASRGWAWPVWRIGCGPPGSSRRTAPRTSRWSSSARWRARSTAKPYSAASAGPPPREPTLRHAACAARADAWRGPARPRPRPRQRVRGRLRGLTPWAGRRRAACGRRGDDRPADCGRDARPRPGGQDGRGAR